MEKVRINLYKLTIILTLLSLILTLINLGRQRDFFYLAIYVSIIGLFFENKNMTLRPFTIALPILFIGLLDLGWYITYEYPIEGWNFSNNYLNISKELLLGSILVLYIDRYKSYISTKVFQQYFLLASGIGFILTSIYALWQFEHNIIRVNMGMNYATSTAYIYSVLSLAFIYTLYLQRRILTYIIAGTLILFSWVIILLTGTRAAMTLYLIVSTIITLYHFRRINIKIISIFLLIAITLGSISYKNHIKPKINQTITEISDFKQGNDDTSLGARFSMWTIGIENGIVHPFGQSTESREKWTKQYVKIHPRFATSMLFINTHLHNEFIEKFSLQGIIGVLFLLLFFISLFIHALKKQNTLLLMTISFLLFYGLTDTILASTWNIMFFITMFSITSFFNKKLFV